MGVIEDAVAAIRAGQLAVLPMDTVYGLCVTPYNEAPSLRVSRLKGRPETMATAIVASDLERLFECVPELDGRSGTLARALLPGPYTLVLVNPARRYQWLTGDRTDTIGVRVPDLPEGAGKDVLAQVGTVAATSANLHGGPEPRTLEDVPEVVKAACAAVVDGGELPGVPSTVIDLTGPEAVVLREGAGSAADAIARLAALG